MNDHRGQTLIEVLVALAIAVLVITAAAILVITSLNNAQFGKNQNQATQYAQEGMEIIRSLRDSNPAGFFDSAFYPEGQYCLDANASDVVPADDSDPTNRDGCKHVGIPSKYNLTQSYARRVSIDKASPKCDNETEITVTVSWIDGACSQAALCHKAQIISCLFQYTVIPTP